jgi:tetratricopeptide (TPR) repeat protein
VDEAILHFQKAVTLRPDIAKAHRNLGDALLQKGRPDEAILQYQEALERDPDYDQAHYPLGYALLQKGRVDEAIVQFQEEVALRPNFAEAQNNLGYCFLQKGRMDEAVTHLQRALEIHPDYGPAHFNLGNALLQKGQVDEAAIQFQKLLAINPGLAEARRNLASIAWRLATSSNPSQRNGAKAIELARQTDQLAGSTDPMMASILAAAYAEGGQFNQAVATARRALELARQDNATMVTTIQAQLKCYEAGSAFRDTVASQ